ncbi:MAG: hypothetical protein Tsb0021_15320 [Chlamydiales bacterium]
MTELNGYNPPVPKNCPKDNGKKANPNNKKAILHRFNIPAVESFASTETLANINPKKMTVRGFNATKVVEGTSQEPMHRCT